MVMIAPRMSTSLNSSGIAVISFDFSAQAACPSDRPYSLAHALTVCSAPRPLVRSWLRRAVFPSTANVGCSTPVSATASARNDRSQLAKEAWKAAGFNAIRTRRKTSLRGTPWGRSSTLRSHPSLRAAQRAIAVGPPAPARTASSAMTRTLDRGCRWLMVERGSSSSWKWTTTSSRATRRRSAMLHPRVLLRGRDTGGWYTREPPRAQALQLTRITYKCALALVPDEGPRGMGGGRLRGWPPVHPHGRRRRPRGPRQSRRHRPDDDRTSGTLLPVHRPRIGPRRPERVGGGASRDRLPSREDPGDRHSPLQDPLRAARLLQDAGRRRERSHPRLHRVRPRGRRRHDDRPGRDLGGSPLHGPARRDPDPPDDVGRPRRAVPRGARPILIRRRPPRPRLPMRGRLSHG